MPPDEESPLESLQRRVYQNEPTPEVGVPTYTQKEQPEEYGWKAPPPPPVAPPKKHMSWTLKFLIGAGIFFVVAGIAAACLVFFNARSISSDNVKITVETPASIASGDIVPIVITIRNGNPTQIQDANLYVTLPAGTRTGDDSDTPITQYHDVLGTVAAGAEVTRTVQVKLYGPENSSVSIPMKVEYRTEGSNAQFLTEEEHSLIVATSPIAVQVQTLSQTPTGQPFTLTVLVRSNASAPVSNIALSAQYPSGFSARSADPAPTATNYFELGTIAPGEQKTIKITGVLTGENADQKVFRFTAGNENPDGTSTLGSAYAEGNATVAITHPFLNVGLSLNREAADTVIAIPGESMSGMLTWENTLQDTLTNASISVVLAGNALNPNSINGGTGFYRSSDMTVIFGRDTDSALAALPSNATGVGSFSFAVKSADELKSVTNPVINLVISVAGEQSSGGSARALSSTLTRSIKIGTTVGMTSVLTRTNASGPVPPVAGTETTYSVQLMAQNTVNSVGAAKASMQLPSYVRYTGNADPSISYNENTRTVMWSVGDLAPNASASGTFQVSFLPSSSQAGTSPTLVGAGQFSGVDRFTQLQVTAISDPLTSELPGQRTSGTVQ